MLLTLKLFSGGNLNVFECFFPPLLSVDFLRPDSLMFKTRILSYFFFGSFSLSLFFSGSTCIVSSTESIVSEQ